MHHKTVRRGNRGHDVICLQYLLNQVSKSIFDHLQVDGIFGRETRRVAELFQLNNALKVDGIVGPNTWNRLYDVAPGPVPKATEAETYANKPVSGGKAQQKPTTHLPLNIYIHGYDAPDLKKSFAMHRGKPVQHYVLGPGKRPKPLSTTIIDDLDGRSARIADLVINTHGSGGGAIKVGGGTWPASAVAKFAGDLKGYFLPGAKIRIYACLFASSREKWGEVEARWNASEGEGYGAGARAMVAIAKAAGVTVSAGFRVQFGTDGAFKGPCAIAYPNGGWKMEKGGDISNGEAWVIWRNGMKHWLDREWKNAW